MKKRLFLNVAAGVLLYCATGTANAGPAPISMNDLARASVPTTEEVQWRGRGPRVGGGPRFRRGGGRGAAIGAGIAAGILGGIAAGALMNRPAYAAPEPVYEPAPAYGAPVYRAPGGGGVEYCMRRYRSYNPNTGTYIGLDGMERACP